MTNKHMKILIFFLDENLKISKLGIKPLFSLKACAFTFVLPMSGQEAFGLLDRDVLIFGHAQTMNYGNGKGDIVTYNVEYKFGIVIIFAVVTPE